jgi:hypothetical protein
MKSLQAGFVVAILIALAVLFILQHQAQEKLRAENVALAEQLAQLQTDNESLSNRLAAAGNANSLSDKEHNELLKLRGEVGMLRGQANEIVRLKQENQQLHALAANAAPSQQADLSPPLYSRHFKINAATFFENLKHSFPANEGETQTQTFVRFLKQNGVELNPPESLFVNDATGELFVRSSETNLNTIESVIEVINSNQ